MTLVAARKPVNKLQKADLDKYKIWQFVTDDEANDVDETWIYPLDSSVIPRGRYTLTVASQFRTSSGHEFSGFISVSTDRDVTFGDAVVLYGDHHILVPISELWSTDVERSKIAQSLGLTIAEFFPIQFRLTVQIENESDPREGYIV